MGLAPMQWLSILKADWGGDAGSSYFKLLYPPKIYAHFLPLISIRFYDSHIFRLRDIIASAVASGAKGSYCCAGFIYFITNKVKSPAPFCHPEYNILFNTCMHSTASPLLFYPQSANFFSTVCHYRGVGNQEAHPAKDLGVRKVINELLLPPRSSKPYIFHPVLYRRHQSPFAAHQSTFHPILAISMEIYQLPSVKHSESGRPSK